MTTMKILTNALKRLNDNTKNDYHLYMECEL